MLYMHVTSHLCILQRRFTWDPILTPQVRQKFEACLGKRVKGMVSCAKSTGKKPNWIRVKLWRRILKKWATAEAKQKSEKASKYRLSERCGLGPHKHYSGPKSHKKIHQEMEEQEGREVSYGEVFIKTHTRKDGTFFDEKAKKVREVYEQKIQETVSKIDSSGPSNAVFVTQLLTVQQRNAIFLDSTIKDARGNPFGITQLYRSHGKGKRLLFPDTKSSDIVELEQKLEDANLKIEEQAKYNKLMFEYFETKDPNLALWLEGNASEQLPGQATLPQTNVPTDSCSTPQGEGHQ